MAERTKSILDNVRSYEAEIILVDDGSQDGSWGIIQVLADLHPDNVRGLRFENQAGLSSALQAGFDVAQGDVVFTMEANLNDDPTEIPTLLNKLDEGYDVVCGSRHAERSVAKFAFNQIVNRKSNLELKDYDSMFKCYRREVTSSIVAIGSHHCMLPSIAAANGFRVAEILIEGDSHKRRVKKSDSDRLDMHEFADAVSIRVYRERPRHFANVCARVYGTPQSQR